MVVSFYTKLVDELLLVFHCGYTSSNCHFVIYLSEIYLNVEEKIVKVDKIFV